MPTENMDYKHIEIPHYPAMCNMDVETSNPDADVLLGAYLMAHLSKCF